MVVENVISRLLSCVVYITYLSKNNAIIMQLSDLNIRAKKTPIEVKLLRTPLPSKSDKG